MLQAPRIFYRIPLYSIRRYLLSNFCLNNFSEKNNAKGNSIAASCKPCTPIERNGNAKERNGTAKNPLSTQRPTSATNTCYSKCSTRYIREVPSKQVDESGKNVKPTTESVSSKSAIKLAANDCEIKPLSVTNPYIEKMEEDILYHIALGNKSHDLPKMFGDVKVKFNSNIMK